MPGLLRPGPAQPPGGREQGETGREVWGGGGGANREGQARQPAQLSGPPALPFGYRGTLSAGQPGSTATQHPTKARTSAPHLSVLIRGLSLRGTGTGPVGRRWGIAKHHTPTNTAGADSTRRTLHWRPHGPMAWNCSTPLMCRA